MTPRKKRESEIRRAEWLAAQGRVQEAREILKRHELRGELVVVEVNLTEPVRKGGK